MIQPFRLRIIAPRTIAALKSSIRANFPHEGVKSNGLFRLHTDFLYRILHPLITDLAALCSHQTIHKYGALRRQIFVYCPLTTKMSRQTPEVCLDFRVLFFCWCDVFYTSMTFCTRRSASQVAFSNSDFALNTMFKYVASIAFTASFLFAY